MWFFLLFVPCLNKITFAEFANKEKLCRRNGLQSPNDRIGFSPYHVRDTKKNSESNVRPSNSLQGLRFVSLSHAGDKTENNFLFFFTELKKFPSVLFYLQT